MRKLITMIAAFVLTTATGWAQDAVPATKTMSQDEVQAALKPFFEKLQAIPEDGNEETVMKQVALDFVKENPNEAGVYVVRAILAFTMPTEELIAYVDGNDHLKNNETIKEQKKVWAIQLETGEGKMFKDFEAEYEGKVSKLSDYVGKGKYVLVDFWASWCGPCKAEIPNLIKVYNQYKGEKFDVLGVATWDKPEDTKKAIEQMGIPYPQMMNAQKAGSDAYGITGIPQIILFGPDGKIVKRNLRGEGIEKAVAEVLK